MNYLFIEETESTNSYCSSHEEELGEMTMVAAERQLCGRGQRGNSWEAAPGENLTFSIFCRPSGVEAREQFIISEATALGVVEYLASRGIEAKVKWPNDIYVGDRKICGILIEHALTGSEISRSILGVGINVNQREFLSDAPNPESMARLTGLRYDIREEARAVGAEIEKLLEYAATPDGRAAIHNEFRHRMWRADGLPHPFRDRASGREFSGVISDVASDGFLSVEECGSGEIRRYAFKEVEFLLKDEDDEERE